MNITDKLAKWQELNARGHRDADELALEMALEALDDMTATPEADARERLNETLAGLDDSASAAAIRDALKAIKGLSSLRVPVALTGHQFDTEKEIPAREWVIDGVLPAGRLSSLYGSGGLGKSRLAMQIAAAVACGGPPICPISAPGNRDQATLTVGRPQDSTREHRALCRDVDCTGHVLWLSWEDEPEEFQRRWNAARKKDVIAGDIDPAQFTYVDMRVKGSGPLWAPAGAGHIQNQATWTDAGRSLISTMPGHRLCVIDPIAAAFRGSENDRSGVREFATALDQMAEQTGCAVLLIGHPPKGDSGYSGSTDWRNAVRAMLQLEVVDAENPTSGGSGGKAGQAETGKGARVRLDKSSYSRAGEEVWLRQIETTSGICWAACFAKDAYSPQSEGAWS